MRGFLLLLIIGAAAWYTRPTHALHRGVASVLMAEGRVTRPEALPGNWAFEDFVVTTRSTMYANDREVMECWGFFARFLCTGAAPQVDEAVARS